MPSTHLSLDDELNEWILKQCGGKKRARPGYIRSILYMVRNGILLIDSSNGLKAYKTKDDWKTIDELRKAKKVSSAIPIYPVELMGDLMSELKNKLGISRETKETITEMRDEQKKISALLAPDPPSS